MAERTFEIRTEPHQAHVGEHTLYFEPEVEGAAFADAYAALKEAQKAITAAGDNVGADELKIVSQGMREFLARFMLEESRTLFEGIRLPDRVLVKILEFVAELYGGGSGNPSAPGGPSSAL